MKVSSNELATTLLAGLFVLGADAGHAQAQRNPGIGEQESSAPKHVVFLTPADGVVVQPGERLHIDIAIPRGSPVVGMVLISTLGISEELREAPPYSFTLTIPDKEGSGSDHLIGIHTITAFGGFKGLNGTELGAIRVDVEESEMPAKLEEVSNGSTNGRPGFQFFDVGQEDWLAIYGTFPNGDDLDLNDSTHLRLASEDAKVAVVEDSRVIAMGPGRTNIKATYALGDQTVQIAIPVSVTVPTTGLIASPRSVDFGDQRTGVASSPLKVTLTNRTDNVITIYKFDIRAEVHESDDCTDAPLPPERNCTISITFTPYRTGPSRGLIYIPNSFSSVVSLPITGNGI